MKKKYSNGVYEGEGTLFTKKRHGKGKITYTNGDDSVSFILNYNIYRVRVRLEDGTVYDLDKLGYVKID